VNRARLLRKKATDTERILWRHLRNRNFGGYKFRRQHPVDCYILDFYCPVAKLAIELDVGGHNYRVGQIRDRMRSAFLARKGITYCDLGIIRFAKNSTASCKRSGLRCRSAAVKTLTLILSLWQRERRASGRILPVVDSRPNRQVAGEQLNSAAKFR
jgi:very-short-patch-repair endonuclease